MTAFVTDESVALLVKMAFLKSSSSTKSRETVRNVTLS